MLVADGLDTDDGCWASLRVPEPGIPLPEVRGPDGDSVPSNVATGSVTPFTTMPPVATLTRAPSIVAAGPLTERVAASTTKTPLCPGNSVAVRVSPPAVTIALTGEEVSGGCDADIGIVLVPMTKSAPPRLIGVPEIVTAGPPAESVTDPIAKTPLYRPRAIR